MAALTNTFLTFAAIGNREDLADIIYNISPVDAPFQAAIGKNKATATYHEWQTDVLASATTNAVVQGDDSTNSFTFTAPAYTKRIGNRTQISRKDVLVSGTQDAVSKAGRKKEMVYQLTKKAKELSRDQEFVLTQIGISAVGGSTTAPTTGSLENWYGLTASAVTTNTSLGAGGANATNTATTIRTDGTQRPLTETLLKGVIQGTWTNGGDVDLIMTGPFNKTVISGFTGNNTRTQDTSDKKLIAAIDIYVSDFGTHRVVANRFSRDRTVHCLMSDMWAVSYLRPKQTIDLAKTGDNEKAWILSEYALENRNDSGSGAVFDLTTS